MHAMHGNGTTAQTGAPCPEPPRPPRQRQLVRRANDGSDPTPTEPARPSRRIAQRRAVWQAARVVEDRLLGEYMAELILEYDADQPAAVAFDGLLADCSHMTARQALLGEAASAEPQAARPPGPPTALTTVHEIVNLQSVGQDALDLIFEYVSKALSALDAVFLCHPTYRRRSLYVAYQWVCHAGELCRGLHSAATKQLDIRRESEWGPPSHRAYLDREQRAVQDDNLAYVYTDVLLESLAGARDAYHQHSRRATTYWFEQRKLEDGASFDTYRWLGISMLSSRFHTELLRYHPHPGLDTPASVALLIEAGDAYTSTVYVRAAVDAPLVDIVVGGHRGGRDMRLFLDGDRLSLSRTPRQLGLDLQLDLHPYHEVPVIQVLFEQTGGGDGDDPPEGAQQLDQFALTSAWQQLLCMVEDHGNPADAGDDEMPLEQAQGALDAAARLLSLTSVKRAANPASDRALHALAIGYVYDLTSNQSCMYAGAHGRTCRRMATNLQKWRNQGDSPGATEPPHDAAAAASSRPPRSTPAPTRHCHGCDGCRKPDCGRCAACLDKVSNNGKRTLNRRCDERKCAKRALIPDEQKQPPMDDCTSCGASMRVRDLCCGVIYGADSRPSHHCLRCPGCRPNPSCSACAPLLGAPTELPPDSASSRPPSPPGPLQEDYEIIEDHPLEAPPATQPAARRVVAWSTTTPQYQARKPKAGQCGHLHVWDRASAMGRPLICDNSPRCKGCWQSIRNVRGPATPLAYPDPAPGLRVSKRTIPARAARAALAKPCCVADADDGAGRTLLLGEPASMAIFELTLQGAPRPLVARRLECIGMYIGGALRTSAEHKRLTAIDPADGAYAVAILDHVLCSAADPTGISLLCEGGWVNAFLHCVEITLADGTAIHAAYAFAAEDIYQETELRILYDDDRASYAAVRETRGYEPAVRDTRGPPDFTAEETASLPDKVWAAFEPEALATALRWGGVIDYGSKSQDTNLLREPGVAPALLPQRALPQPDPHAEAVLLGATDRGRDQRAERRRQAAPPRAANDRPLLAEQLERGLGRHVPCTEDADAVASRIGHPTCKMCFGCPAESGSAFCAGCASGAVPGSGSPAVRAALCRICFCTLDAHTVSIGLCYSCSSTLPPPTTPRPSPPTAPPPDTLDGTCPLCGDAVAKDGDACGGCMAASSPSWTPQPGAGTGGWHNSSLPAGDPNIPWWVGGSSADARGITAEQAGAQDRADATGDLGGPLGAAVMAIGSTSKRRRTAAPAAAATRVHPAMGVARGVDCSEPERQVRRRARFSTQPGSVHSVHTSHPVSPKLFRITVCDDADSARENMPPLANPFRTDNKGMATDHTLASTEAYDMWLRSGDDPAEIVADQSLPRRVHMHLVRPPLIHGQEADGYHTATIDLLARSIPPLLRGMGVEVACSCPLPRGGALGQDVRRSNCTCHGAAIARFVTDTVLAAHAAEQAAEEASTRRARAAPPTAPRKTTRSDPSAVLNDGLEDAVKRPRPKAKPAPDPDGMPALHHDDDYDSDEGLELALALSASEAEGRTQRIYATFPGLRGHEGTTSLHLFAGPERADGLAAALRTLGHRVIELDVKRDASHDLSDHSLQQTVLDAIGADMFSSVLVGTPCKSCSILHGDGESDKGKAPWRTKEHPLGRPDLGDAAMAFLASHYALFQFSAQVLTKCTEHGTPAILENPAPRDDKSYRSYWAAASGMATIWHMPCIVELRQKAGALLRLVVVPQCAFGRGPHGNLFQKYTGLLCTPDAASYLETLNLSCHHTSAQHDSAAGRGADGASNSEMAAAYPANMYLALACALTRGRVDVQLAATTHERLLAALTSSRLAITSSPRAPMVDTPPAPPSPPHAAPPPSPGALAAPHSTASPPLGPPPDTQGGQGDGESDATQTDEDEGPRPPVPELLPPAGAQGHPAGQPVPAHHEPTDHGGTTPQRPRPLEPVEQGRGATVPSTPQRSGHSTSLPLLHFGDGPATNNDSVVIVPVRTSAITGGAPLALMPLHSGVFGILESKHARSGRREAVVDTAAALASEVGVHKDVCFLAGELDASGRGFDDDTGVRTSVVVAPCCGDTISADVALTPHDTARLMSACAAQGPGAEPQVWMTLDALAAAAESADSTARYRAAATAIAMAEAHIRPTPEAPSYIRSGARARKHAQAPTSKSEPGAIPLDERIRRADAACEELHAELLRQDAADDPSFAEFCDGLASQISNCDTGQIPDELLGTILPKPPSDLSMRPFKHRAQVLRNLPRPLPAAQEPPADGWWPRSVEDIVREEPLRKIRDWLRRCEQWHRRGGLESERPAAEAYGEDSLHFRARGRRWDLRGGPGHITLWRDYTDEERQARTCINLKFAKELFADCIDEEFVQFLIAGVRFHAGLENQIVLMPNLLSLYRDGGVGAAAAQADDMVRLGFIAVFDDLPSVPYRIIPRGVVPKAGTDELRGIADQGAPRKPLYTRRMRGGIEWEKDIGSTLPDGEVVEALNAKCRADKLWDHEDKDTLSHAAFNGAVLQSLADITGEVTIEIALDMSKWFHRMFYSAYDLWTTGAIIPSEATGGARLAIELAMTMGATPASQIAQRFANAMVQQVCIEMDRREAAARAADPLHIALQRVLDARNRTLAADSYSVQGRLYDLTYYSDDGHGLVVGVIRAVRFLRAFWTVAGPHGLNAPLSRASKQQIGVCVVWLGGTLAAGLGLVWIPKEKVARAALGISTALDGKMCVGDYRRLVGFLVSVLFMLGGDKNLLNHIFRPLKPGCHPPNEIDGGPATPVGIDVLMQPTLSRWLLLILNTPGAVAMSAVEPTPPASTAPRHRIRTDAALQGTPRPGLGGCMYGLWWALAIADHPGLETLDIPHLELLAACLGILTYAEMLQGAEHVDIDTDALATAIALQERARSPTLQAILDALMLNEVYQDIAPRLGVVHLFGASNILSDAASRGYDDTLRSVADALGITPKRIALSENALCFLQIALDNIAGLRPGAGKGSTAIHRGNPNLRGDHPIAHGAAGDSKPRSPTAAPLQDFVAVQPHRRRRTPYADGPEPSNRPPPAHRSARTPPPLPMPPARRGRHHLSYAQAVSPTAAPLGRGPGASPAHTLAHPRAPGTSFRARLDAAEATPRRGASPLTSPQPPRPTPPAPCSPTSAPLHRGPAPRRDAAATVPPPPQRGPRAASELDIARSQLTGQMADRLRADDSEHALMAEDGMLEWMCEMTMGDPDDTPMNTQSNLRSNWRHWTKYCAAVGPNVSPWRPNIEELDALGVERERVLWTAGLIWIYKYSMKPKPGNYIRFGEHAGKPQPCAPKNALAILRGVRKEHLDRGRTPPALTLATRRMHEMTMRYARWIGPENLVARKKTTLTHILIAGMLAVGESTVLSIRKPSTRARVATTDDIDRIDQTRSAGTIWSWKTDFGVSCNALINVLAQTGFRKAEVTTGGEAWGNMNISFAHLTWRFQGRPDTAAPTAHDLFNIKDGDYAILRPPPSKCDQHATKWGNSPIWLPFSAHATINAARALARWELKARVAPDARRTTPLFCGPGGIDSAMTEGVCDDMFHGLLGVALNDKAAAKEYSIHSFRSYLASSLLASGCSDIQIQAALRWASAEALAEYKQINAEVYGGWILGAEKQKLTGLRAAGLARLLPQTDDLLHHQTIHGSRTECNHEAAVADNDVGSHALIETFDGRAEPEPTVAGAYAGPPPSAAGSLPLAIVSCRR